MEESNKVARIFLLMMALTILVGIELARIQMRDVSFNISFFSNRWLIALASFLLLQVVVIYMPILQKIFSTIALRLIESGIVLSIIKFIFYLDLQ